MEPTVSPTMAAGPATMSDSDLAPGTPVGEYVIESKIGEGGFGAVFRATHPLIGKVAAIKVLSKRFSADRDMVSRFHAEARAVNQIRHRNIIDIFSFGTINDGRCYYVMELLDGEPLDHRIRRQRRIPLAEALPILRAIAKAIDAAHEKGIAHRDLKAENVFLATDSDGGVFPKLLDFGIAKLMDPDDGGAIAHKTRTGAPMGTPYYMSPEQCRGRNIDTRTDHYAFGVLAYVMLTGKFPIDAEDYMTILMRQVSDDPDPPSKTVPELSQGVDHTIAWLMAKDPAQRPENLTTAVRALEEAAGMPAAVSGQHATVTPSALAKIPTAITRTDRAMTATAAASTIAPGKSRVWMVIAMVAIAAIAAVIVVIAMRGGSKEEPVKPAVASNTPAPDAAPAKPPADAPAQVAAADAAPSNITVTLADAPAGAEVHIGGRMFGTAPKVMIPHGELEAILVISADGYITQSIPLTPNKDQTISVKLKKKEKDATPVGIGSSRPPPIRTGSGSAKVVTPKPGSAVEPTDDIDTFPKTP